MAANPRKFSEKIALLNQKQAEETAAFEAIMKEVSDVTSRTALNNLEEMQHNSMIYRGNQERGRSMGVGPLRSRTDKRHDTSPYGGAYLSPPTPDTWRRASSDSALHQSANEACQSSSSMAHRRGSDAYQHSTSSAGNDNVHHGFIERPRSSCEMPRVPGINIYPSSQPPGQQIPIGNNTGSLPDLSNFPAHFPAPLHTPLDQEEHSSGSPYSNNHLSVPVNSRFLHTCKGVALENSTSTSQQDLQSYSQQTPHAVQQPPASHSPGQYIYQQPHSPQQPQSPKASQQSPQQNSQLASLGSYRTSQAVNRPSPQSSPSLTVQFMTTFQLQGSPLSYSNNPSAPSSPTSGHHAPSNLTLDNQDQSFFNQINADFEHFSMSDIINVANELGGDAGYYSTSPLQQMAYQPRTPTTTQQLTPQTPNTPTITLTDCSLVPDDLTNTEFAKDLVPAISATFGQDLFSTSEPFSPDMIGLGQDINALRQGLDPLDDDDLQRLHDSTMVISDASAEAHFRLEQR